ncbi:hypothetical protein [Agarivorans sp. DSG3-1]|uniref:hypothetical protein n=1 Tax=Agarivorans sp. DSG3-1 TaxID=3342249 RepID=UPI00398E767A
MRHDGKMILFIGVSRSGKSVPVKRIVEKQKRVLAFDPKGEYVAQMGFKGFTDKGEFLKAVRECTGGGKFSLIASDPKSFQFFCDVAFNWNRQAPAAVVCEELAAVTNSSKAAGAWGRLINQGLAYQPLIIGTVQRGQEVDKTLMNNASFVHVCRHNTDDDAAYIASKLGISVTEIPREPLQFFQWTSDKGIVCRGVIDFKGASGKNWKEGSPRFRAKGKNKLLTLTNSGEFQGVIYR